jgi:hypothetical protein
LCDSYSQRTVTKSIALHPYFVSEYLTATPSKFLQSRQGIALFTAQTRVQIPPGTPSFQWLARETSTLGSQNIAAAFP